MALKSPDPGNFEVGHQVSFWSLQWRILVGHFLPPSISLLHSLRLFIDYVSIILACNHLPAVALTLYSSWSTIFTWWPALPNPALNLFPGVSIDNVSILLGHLLPSMLQYFCGWPGSLPPWPQGSPLAACWRKKVSECGETPRSCPNSSISSTKVQKYQYQMFRTAAWGDPVIS